MIRILPRFISYSQILINQKSLSKPNHRLFPHISIYNFSTLPKHQVLTMPALSPTMSEGKIMQWTKKVGDKLEPGDIICQIQTDKATVGFQVQDKGYLAQKLDTDQAVPVGTPLVVVVKKASNVKDFQSYKFSDGSEPANPQIIQQLSEPSKSEKESSQKKSPQKATQSTDSGRTFISPVAKVLANNKGINIQQIGKGSGPQGVILKQDVEAFLPTTVKQQVIQKVVIKKQAPSTHTPTTHTPPPPPPATKKSNLPDNPYQQIPLSSMRKTIAARLTQSKQTIPHYYIDTSIAMDKMMQFRTQMNKNQKQNQVRITVNDIIIKAMALALRDYPAVNSQWLGNNVIRRFKHADISVAVATQGGLITPIVFRADQIGLIEIAKRTKDIAKRAQTGKLQINQFVGGTSTISNLGMFGINTVASVINPPQSTILGVGKTQKQIVFDPDSTNPQKVYKVQNTMQVIVSADHRVVDGAVAAQWVTRIKKYLENPPYMLL